jgi:hypothetical protein
MSGYDRCTVEGIMADQRTGFIPERSDPALRDEERAELEAIAVALARSPRLVRLVRYLGEKYFLGQIDQLHEYNIATEVFERSKTVFDAGEDAIARVEAHRLRKRLKEYYLNEGKNHTVKLTIPSGTYVPVFVRQVRELPPPTSDQAPEIRADRPDLPQAIETAPSELIKPSLSNKIDVIPPSLLLQLRRPVWLYSLLIVLLLVSVLGIYWIYRSPANAKGGAASPAPASSTAASQALALNSAQQPIRILAGYSGHPQIDSAGILWKADEFFHGGGTWLRPANFLARTSDPLLYEQWRTGDFAYDIPLRPGVYELHLYFVTSDRADEAPASFSVGINGSLLLPGFEVNTDALGANIADERVFRDISPAQDGFLHIQFTSERGAPALNAIAILPGTPHKQLPIRLVTQLTPVIDHNGNFWHPDNYFMNGRLSTQRQQMSGSPDPDLFAAERYGHFTYAIPVDTRDRYTLILHFAEFYFGPQASGVGGVGSRVFRVMCNGETLLDNFDIFKEAGSLHAITKTFYHLRPSAQGKLNLTFEPVTNNATVSGIEVLDESQ